VGDVKNGCCEKIEKEQGFRGVLPSMTKREMRVKSFYTNDLISGSMDHRVKSLRRHDAGNQ
jgi:hypothetical protein